MLLDELIRIEPTNARYLRDLTVSLDRSGEILLARGEVDAAAGRFSRGLEVAERLSAAYPTNPEFARDVAVALAKLGDVAVARRDPDTARRHYERSPALRETLASRLPTQAGPARDVLVVVFKLGALQQGAGRPEAGCPILRQGRTRIAALREAARSPDLMAQDLAALDHRLKACSGDQRATAP